MARGRFGNGGNLAAMHTVQPGLTASAQALALALMLALTPAPAQTLPAARQADRGPVVAPPPAGKPVQRRSVRQTIEATPRIVTDGHRPTLRSGPPAPAPAPPFRLDTCDAGGCFDSSGARFNGGGAPLLGPKGQLCTRGVVNAQCF